MSTVLKAEDASPEDLHPPSTSLSAVSIEESPVYIKMCNLLNDTPVPEEEFPIATLDPTVFAHPLRRDILFLCVNFYRDSLRQGTASTKTRGEVRGSGRKLFNQKGSGKARVGDGQSPTRVGGGTAFGPKPRDFSTKLPRKVRQMGMRVALSARVRENALGIAQTLDWPGVKTNEFARRLRKIGWTQALLVTGHPTTPPHLERVSRNIGYMVKVVEASSLNIFDLLKWPKIILDVEAVQYFERLLGKNVPEDERIPMPSPPILRFSRIEAGRQKKRSQHILGVDDVKDRDLIYE